METLHYRTIQPPFTLKFREMSRKELIDYFRWFLQILPERAQELTNVVKSTTGFSEDWNPDYMPRSLDTLGRWFATQVQTRPRTEEETAEFEARSQYPIDRPQWELTDRTFSMAMDVGMYLAQTLLRNHPSLKWDQPFGSKKFIDYGQPVIVGFKGNVPLNPVHIVITLAYGVAAKTKTGKTLRELYDTWSGMVNRP